MMEEVSVSQNVLADFLFGQSFGMLDLMQCNVEFRNEWIEPWGATPF